MEAREQSSTAALLNTGIGIATSCVFVAFVLFVVVITLCALRALSLKQATRPPGDTPARGSPAVPPSRRPVAWPAAGGYVPHHLALGAAAAATTRETAMNLLFAEARDVVDATGALQFGANGLRRLGDVAGLPPLSFPCPVLQPDGSYLVYGATQRATVIRRFRTWDGFRYEGGETVLSLGPAAPSGGEWLGCLCLAHGRRCDDLFCFAWAKAPPGMGLWGYASSGGQPWRPLADAPLYRDHDAFHVLWHPSRECLVACQVTYQRWHKPFADNIGQERRRVLSFRASPDGRHWDPPEDVCGDSLRHERDLLTPDAQDPAELEFYRLVAFPFHDRFVGMVLLYAASPGAANVRHPWTRHGPHLGGEWWTSDDGLAWRRPFRAVFAPGEAGGIAQHAPMRLGNRLLWLFPDGVYGLPEDRLFFAGAFASAAFSTPCFVQPDRHLALNAEFGFHDHTTRGMRGQGYIAVEALDEEGRTLPGFEEERCILHDLDAAAVRAHQTDRDTARRLHWQGKSLRELAGRRLRLRFRLRDARIYGLREDTYF